MPSAEPRPASAGLAYHQLQRLGARDAWRPLVGALILFIGVWYVLAILVVAVITPHNVDGEPVTPSYLSAINVWWALAIPSACLVAWLINKLPPRWLFSVLGRFRWGWFAGCLGLALVTLVVTAWVSSVLPSQGSSSVDLSGHLNPWTSQMRDFLLVVLLLTPLQAAGEEFVFRGYLTQSVGNLFHGWSPRARSVVAVVVPAFLFGLAHGIGQDVPVFFDRFAFGLVAGVLVQLTGGLEAGIAMHVMNNLLTFGIALAYGDMTSTLHVTESSWWAIPVTLTQSLVYLALCWWLSRRMRVDRRSAEGVLEAREPAR
ncbi:MAG: CPBP family intramembrane metalloprotease [Nocardioidaceae bacterium]|nr:CPBP family intramembrane metalloprotease [Nocardioidaceae bacterium]